MNHNSAEGSKLTYGVLEQKQYPGDGFKFDFLQSWTSAEANTELSNLMNNKWVDQQTRVVIIYLTTYNAAYDM